MNYRNIWTCIFINNTYDSLKFNLFHKHVCPFTLIPIVPKDNYINNFSLVVVLVKHSIGEGVGL